jgi:hypothetical protein
MPALERLCERRTVDASTWPDRFVSCPRRDSAGGLEVTVEISTTTTTLARREEVFTSSEESALVGFLAGYSGMTREAYALDLRQYVQWSTDRSISLFGARRSDIELFGRHLEHQGRARATIARRLCTIACFYRYAEEEGLIPVSPRGSCPPPTPRLRITRSRPRPQRGRRHARRRPASPAPATMRC